MTILSAAEAEAIHALAYVGMPLAWDLGDVICGEDGDAEGVCWLPPHEGLHSWERPAVTGEGP